MKKDNSYVVYYEYEPVFLAKSYYQARKFIKYLKKYSFYDDSEIFLRRF